jgi:hypothetical protein
MFIKKFFIACFLCLLTFSVASLAMAADQSEGGPRITESVSLDDPLGGTTPEQFIGQVIKSVLGVVGSLALVMFIYGGLVWMTAAGNSQKIDKGKSILTWATIGLVVIFASYALVNFVITDVIGA